MTKCGYGCEIDSKELRPDFFAAPAVVQWAEFWSGVGESEAAAVHHEIARRNRLHAFLPMSAFGR